MSVFAVRSATAAVVRPWARWARARVAGEVEPPPPGRLPVSELKAWRLEPLIYSALSSADDPRRAPLRAVAREAAGANLVRPAALRPILSRFDEQGVHYALYKGAGLTLRHPALRGVRAVSDADVLVHPRDFRFARKLLLEAGLSEIRAYEPFSIAWNNERVFVRAQPKELHVDLHRGLHRAPIFAALSEAAIRSARWQDGFWVASDALAPLLIAAHRAKHGYTADARELFDFRFVLDRLDERALRALVPLADDFDMAGALYCAWTLVRWWFGPGAAVEEESYDALVARVGPFRESLDLLASLDSPFESDKPWRRAPFLKMYLPMTLLTGRVVAPLALAALHAAARSVDVAVAGPLTLYSVAARKQIANRSASD